MMGTLRISGAAFALRQWKAVGLAIALGLGLSACAETQLVIHAAKRIDEDKNAPKKPVGGIYKVGDPYQIGGVWYYPAEDYAYDETGVASWYGEQFHAKLTANGERFDMNDITAAHRTLPLPSFVRVTNLDNGRSLIVRVNDRGPFAHGRILDLSRRSAQLLGMERQGTARVRVQILAEESRQLAAAIRGDGGPAETKASAAPRIGVSSEPLPPPGAQASKPAPVVRKEPPPPPPRAAPMDVANLDLSAQHVAVSPVKPTNLYVQAGAFSRHDNAERVSTRLGVFSRPKVTSVVSGQQEMFRVRIGPLASLDEADTMLEKVISAGYPDARLVVD